MTHPMRILQLICATTPVSSHKLLRKNNNAEIRFLYCFGAGASHQTQSQTVVANALSK